MRSGYSLGIDKRECPCSPTYPAYREAIYSLINKEKAAQIIEKTEELLPWLRAQIL